MGAYVGVYLDMIDGIFMQQPHGCADRAYIRAVSSAACQGHGGNDHQCGESGGYPHRAPDAERDPGGLYGRRVVDGGNVAHYVPRLYGPVQHGYTRYHADEIYEHDMHGPFLALAVSEREIHRADVAAQSDEEIGESAHRADRRAVDPAEQEREHDPYEERPDSR